jgi:Uma2 family endonuclease
VPDLAIEIVSPSSVRRDRIEKRIACARAGVSEYWIVDPERREIAIHATLGDRFAEPRVATTGPVESHVLPEPRLTVGQILAPPR